MSALKRAAEDEVLAPTSQAPSATASTQDPASSVQQEHTAAPAPTHLYVVLALEEYSDGLDSPHEGPRPLGVARTLQGATGIVKRLYDAHEAKRAASAAKEGGKDSEAAEKENKEEKPVEFPGLNTMGNKGKLVGEARVGGVEVRVERWKVAEGKTLATGEQFTHADAAAFAPTTRVHYAYTVVYSSSDYCGDFGAHAFGAVVLRPSAVPALTCAKLPSKGSAAMKLPSDAMDTDPEKAADGVLVAEGQDRRGKGKRHAGSARRWVVRDWEEGVGKKAKAGPARKKARTE
ncbi:hypothetical protein B0H11DRAFT_2195735 [Mycena galericulata]|nr:hypothetical protein B0H11DRAFT_2195735 [Mycena galericulata]